MGEAARGGPRDGFTLVEALVALTLSTVLVGLVTSVFIAQSDFYDDVNRRSRLHANVRSVLDVVAGDVRAVSQGGVFAAQPGRLIILTPLTVGVICDIQGSLVSTYLPQSGAGLDTTSVTGYAFRESDGTWDWSIRFWNTLYDSQGTAVKDDCGDIGMDTTGIPASHFVSLAGPGSSSDATVGGAFMLHRMIDLRFQASGLEPGRTGLYRGTLFAPSPVEIASGLGSNTGFSYRLKGQSGFTSTVAASEWDEVNAVRVTVEAVDPGGGGLDPYEYTVTRDVPIRNEDWD